MSFVKTEKHSPLLAGIDDIFSDESDLVWEKYFQLPRNKQLILKSVEISDFIYGVEQNYHLNDIQTEEFSRSVRKYFFGELDKNALIQKIGQLCAISKNDAEQLFIFISNIRPKNENDVSEKYEYLTLQKALEKYPQIQKQIITSKQIFSQKIQRSLTPNVKNWIMIYDKEMGFEKHTSIQRGNFIFRSIATSNLSPQERNLLSILFKAYDDGIKITIDIKNKKIIFKTNNLNKNIQNNQKFSQQTKNSQLKKQIGKISFSSNHTMPVEKDKIKYNKMSQN